jgi:hypothetical protein
VIDVDVEYHAVSFESGAGFGQSRTCSPDGVAK